MYHCNAKLGSIPPSPTPWSPHHDEDETEADDAAEDERVAALAKVDLAHDPVERREAACKPPRDRVNNPATSSTPTPQNGAPPTLETRVLMSRKRLRWLKSASLAPIAMLHHEERGLGMRLLLAVRPPLRT